MNDDKQESILRALRRALPKLGIAYVREIEALAAEELDKRRG